MLNVLCKNNKIIWVFTTASKQSHVHIIRFILKTLKNEQHQCKHVIVDKYGALENATDVTDLLVGDFIISMKTTGGVTSWINGKN